MRYLTVFVIAMMLFVHPVFAGNEPLPQGYSVSNKINLPRGMQLLLLEPEGNPANAVLMTLDSKGKVIYQKQLDSTHAKVERARLVPGRASYSLTEDKSAGFGSYAGPGTTFFEAVKGRPRWYSARREKSGKLARISVTRSLKTDWKIMPSIEGKGRDIYQISCRPDSRYEGEFLLTYTRYHFDGRHWVRHERRENGFWESGNPFPYRTNFP